MRHVFILNPVAGKNQTALTLRGKIDAYFSRHPELEYRVRLTDGVGAATRIAREECEMGDPVRLYACGGDGTLQETANGIPVGRDDVELTVIPCGSGNDYVRTFGGSEAFCELADLIEGQAVPVDAVDCGDRISLNIASIGLDASVGHKMQRYKGLPGVSGSMAYNIAVVDVVCHPIGVDMTIEIDSEDGVIRRQGKYLMTLAANGRFYGGGYQGAPTAVPDDGLLEFVLVKKISRFEIPFVLGKYKAGEHEGVKCIETIRGSAMRVQAVKPMMCNIDGECFATDSISFRILPNAYRFVLPSSLAAAQNKKNRAVATV
ncbi:MAG: diacylglycerol kinase family lipid kinase [Clostridia bacterium]|nr:diacylglycerol kinase family lipid kinase [Clostridia bacterium]